MATHSQNPYGKAVNGTSIPRRRTQDIPVTEQPESQERGRPERIRQNSHPLAIFGATMCAVLLILMLYQTQVLPRWTHYQDQLACGAGHVCKAVVSVAPGKRRTFLALIQNGRIAVIELPDSNGNDSHVYLGASLTDDWQGMTIYIKPLHHGAYDDVLLDAPEFQGTDPVLYNHSGSYSWNS